MIGADPMCQLRATYDGIGQQHCAFAVRVNKVFLSDLGSGMPTLVNGETVPESGEWPLHKGDRISIGPLHFMINFREKQLSQRDLEEWALKQLDEDTGPKKSAIQELLEAENADPLDDDAATAAGAIINKLSALKGIVRGRLRIAREGSITIVRINDIYLVDDAELDLLKKELHDNLNHKCLRVLIDFKNVRRMSAAAAQLFADLVKWLHHQDSRLAMCRLRPELLSMMKGMPIEDGFTLFPDKARALAAKW
jgi:anti-anti-sigma regulatory factor